MNVKEIFWNRAVNFLAENQYELENLTTSQNRERLVKLLRMEMMIAYQVGIETAIEIESDLVSV